MLENIFFSFSFSEFKSLVNLVNKRVGESVMLKQCGLIPHHLAKLEAYKEAPLENSLKQVRNSRYMVCLLGKSAGSEVIEGKTYIECEIEAALESGVDVFAFLIGDIYQNLDEMPSDIERIYNQLKSISTVGIIETDDAEFVARTITKALESDVWQALGEDEQYAITNDLLEVSGFPRRQLDRLPGDITAQLKRIYDSDSPNSQLSPLAANLAQRKCWAYQSLHFGHTDDAVKNLQKAVDEFGSDFFSCFWLGRLFALYATKETQLKRVNQIVERTLSMLDDSETLLRSLCFTHLAVATSKLGNIPLAQQYFEKAVENFKTYDVFEYFAAMCFQQLSCEHQKEQPSQYWLNLAVENLSFIQRSRLSYYVQVHAKFKDAYGASFQVVDKQLNKKWDAFFAATYKSTDDNCQWAKNNFGFKFSKLPSINETSGPMAGAFLASELIWNSFRALRFSSNKIINRFQLWRKQRGGLEESSELFEMDYYKIMAYIDKSCKILEKRLESELEKMQFEKKYSSHKKKKIKHTFFLMLTSIGLGGLINVFTSLNYFYIVSPLLVLVYIYYMRLQDVGRGIREIVDIKQKEINMHNADLAELKNQVEYEANEERIKVLLPDISVCINCINVCDFKAAEEAIKKYYEDYQQALFTEQLENSDDFINLRNLLSDWYSRVDKLEQYSVSAHNGQYNHRLCRKARVSVARKAELGSDSLRFLSISDEATADDLKGRALHVEGSRLRAWFDDEYDASVLLKTLGLIDSNIEQTVKAVEV